MPKHHSVALAVVTCLLSAPALAVPAATTAPAAATAAAPANPPIGSVVSAVQSPAWLVHGGTATVLRPGMTVDDGDTLRTAAGGRVYLELPEHSTVKLGENTEFMTPSMQMAKDDQGALFKGVLHVLKGVFRFTTSLVGHSERRHVDIQVGVATIGVRGTDVWGRSSDDGSLVALLEGKVSMDMPGHESMMMEQPMHYMTMASGGADMKMGMDVTPDKVADWAAQTDVAAGSGVLTGDGKWAVALLSSNNEEDILDFIGTLAAAGYPAEDVQVTVNGKQWHRLVIMQVSSLKDARALGTKVAKVSPAIKPWPYQPK